MVGMNASARRSPDGRGQAVRTKRVLAALVYTTAFVICLAGAVRILGDLGRGAPWFGAIALVGLLIPWWIGAGVGVRLGMEPREYFRGIGRLLGL